MATKLASPETYELIEARDVAKLDKQGIQGAYHGRTAYNVVRYLGYDYSAQHWIEHEFIESSKDFMRKAKQS